MKYLFSLLFIVISINATAKVHHINLIFAAEMPEITSNYGHYPQLGTLLKQQRALSNNTYFYFGGDSLGPSILSSLDQGSHIIDLLNSLEPDAMGVSKREFSFYSANLSLRAFDAIFPVVATNIIDNSTNKPLDNIVTSSISYQGNTKLGFLSIIEHEVLDAYSKGEIRLIEPIKAITQAAYNLRQQDVDAVVLHYGGDYPEISALLDKGIIDLSIHKDENHQSRDNSKAFSHPKDVFITRAQDVAVISLAIDKTLKKPITKITWQAVDVSTMPKDKFITKQINNYINRLNMVLDIKIGTTNNDLTTKRNNVRNYENIFGNYITDSIKDFSNADLALINSGLIRGDTHYKKGQTLTRGDIINELPYRNYVVLIELTGQQLIDSLENAFSLLESNNGRFPQISGFNVSYNSLNSPGKRVSSVSIDNKSIDKNQTYRVATTNYLTSGSDGFDLLKTAPKIADKMLATRLISDIVMDYIIKDKVINGAIEGRIIDNDKSK